MNYALLDENGVVVNVIWLYPANADDFPNAVPMNDVPAMIGDTYADGFFYSDGERILSTNEKLHAQMEDMQSALENVGVTLNG